MLTVVPDEGDEDVQECACCTRPMYLGDGAVERDEKLVAYYFYCWSEGHEGRFLLAVCPCDDEGDSIGGVAVVEGRVAGENVEYGVLDPEDSPWKDFVEFGATMRREEALEEFGAERLFELVDAVALGEPRLSERILASRLSS